MDMKKAPVAVIITFWVRDIAFVSASISSIRRSSIDSAAITAPTIAVVKKANFMFVGLKSMSGLKGIYNMK